MPGGELSEAQRVYCLAQFDAGVESKEIAAALGCSTRCIQKNDHSMEGDL
jgi:hypothetical protein